jgi:hypothetical protein
VSVETQLPIAHFAPHEWASRTISVGSNQQSHAPRGEKTAVSGVLHHGGDWQPSRMVRACAVVTRDVSTRANVVGVPARFVAGHRAGRLPNRTSLTSGLTRRPTSAADAVVA